MPFIMYGVQESTSLVLQQHFHKGVRIWGNYYLRQMYILYDVRCICKNDSQSVTGPVSRALINDKNTERIINHAQNHIHGSRFHGLCQKCPW